MKIITSAEAAAMILSKQDFLKGPGASASGPFSIFKAA